MNKVISLLFVLACIVAVSYSLPLEDGQVPISQQAAAVLLEAENQASVLNQEGAVREKRQFGYGGYGGYGGGRGYGGYGRGFGGGYGGGFGRGFGGGYGGYGGYGR